MALPGLRNPRGEPGAPAAAASETTAPDTPTSAADGDGGEEHEEIVGIRREAVGRKLTQDEIKLINGIKRREDSRAKYDEDSARVRELWRPVRERQKKDKERGHTELGAAISERWPGRSREEILALLEKLEE